MKRLVYLIAILVCFILAGRARAQDNPDVNMDLFAPSVHAWDLGTIMTTRLAPDYDFNAGLWLTYRKDPLVFQSPAGSQTQLVGDQLVADLYFAIPLFGLLSVGLDIPVFLMASGDSPGAVIPVLDEVSGASLGDIRLSVKVRFWDNGNKGFGLGLAEDVTVPTATGDKLTGEGGVTSRTLLIADYAWQGYGQKGIVSITS